MSIRDGAFKTIDGTQTAFAEYDGQTVLVVNVASECTFTRQYAGLEWLYDTFRDRGFTVLAFPCDQFGGKEPGSAKEIAEFCSVRFGVTFPLFQKVEVNGPGRHPLFDELTDAEDENGQAGDVAWNFEKFLVSPEGRVVARFRSETAPEDPALVAAIEATLTD
jgi:glutathione peroxidase